MSRHHLKTLGLCLCICMSACDNKDAKTAFLVDQGAFGGNPSGGSGSGAGSNQGSGETPSGEIPKNPETPAPEQPSTSYSATTSIYNVCASAYTLQERGTTAFQAIGRHQQILLVVRSGGASAGGICMGEPGPIIASIPQNEALAQGKLGLTSAVTSRGPNECLSLELVVPAVRGNAPASSQLGELLALGRTGSASVKLSNLLSSRESDRRNFRSVLVAPTLAAGEEVPPGTPSPGCEGESPLMVDLRGNGIQLSSQADGVDFDIDGDGTPDRISWPTKKDDVFLALPTEQNEVESVQQLFGNNTVGPDGQKAANGFAALKKFDLNNDDLISKDDPVYSKLVLWSDLNRDGHGTSKEFMPLARARVVSIDLRYIEMMQTDSYGNETRQRSVIRVGTPRFSVFMMIFDVWFRPI